jgi:glutamate racemase
MDNRPIGIFDSGVGGLSVLLEIQRLLPNETSIFFADQAFVPYGEKTQEELVDRVTKIIEFLRTKNIKAVVVACNTATVYTIDEIRKKFDLPIIGTVPVVKTLASVSKTRKGAVLSTPATAKSPYLTDLIQKFALDMEIAKVGGSKLEELVEAGDLDSPKINQILQETLEPLVTSGVDALALGCTHYPFLRAQIVSIVGPNVAVLDSGAAVARRLQEILRNNDTLATQKTEDEYYTTGDEDKFRNVAQLLTKKELSKVSQIQL